MWQRFTERARRIIFFAQEEAARLGENYVGTEHILLGLVREPDSVAARILDRLDIPLDRIRLEIEAQVTRGHGNLGQNMQLTPRAKRVIDLAYEEARQLNNNYIGTEHLLLGLIREGDGLASRVLVNLGADLERARREVYALQESEGSGSPALDESRPSQRPDGGRYFDNPAVQILQYAREEAARLGSPAVGTEHLLLGLTRAPNSAAARALEHHGVPLYRLCSRVERQVIGSLTGSPQPFTWHALRVIDLAHETARQCRNDYIGAEHLLLALIQEADSSAAFALHKAGITWDRVYAQVRQFHDEGAMSGDRRADHFIGRAREAAEASGASAVSTEHLLLSLIGEEESAAVRILEALGVSLEELRAGLQPEAAAQSDEPGAADAEAPVRPLTPRAQEAIERGREEARRLRSDRIGSEHLLLGLVLECHGFGGQVLMDAGVSLDHLLTVISETRAERPRPRASQQAGAAAPKAGREPPRRAATGDEPADSPGWHRFTERARRIIHFAQEEAAKLRENYVGTEHILLGLTREDDSVAARILGRIGVPLGSIRSDIERQVTRGNHKPGEDMQLTPRAKRAIDLAHDEARQLNNNYIGTEHLLLGLIREGDGLAARVLVKLGADLERARREVYMMQVSEKEPTSSPGPPTAEATEAGTIEDTSPDRLEQLAQATAWATMAPAGRRQAARAAAATARAVVASEGQLSDFVSINDLTPVQARALLTLALVLKASGDGDRLAHREILPGKALAMIFEKPSLRTRVTFEVGMFQLGGHAVSLQPAEIQLGQRETVADAARNLERWVDGIMARTFSHQHVVELARNAGVPVINGLTDREHPCQALADFLTIREKKGRTEGVKLAFIGDGNNVAHSLLLLGARLGTHVTVAGPEGYEPDAEIVRQAQETGAAVGARIEVTRDPLEAVRDADVIYTDVWASMGQEAEAEERAARFAPYQVNADLVKQAKWDAIVMHDLPAHRGQEITDEVMDGPQSVIFDQAENRLHAQKALLAVLLG